jgi:hypothetical protein
MGAYRRPFAALVASLLVATLGGACGSSPAGSVYVGTIDSGAGGDASVGDGTVGGDSANVDENPSFLGDGAAPLVEAANVFDVEPSALQTITVTAGQTTPTVTYVATIDGNPVAAAWIVDRGDLASIGAGPAPTGTLSPTGTTGGLVNVIAGYDGQTLQRPVFIQISATQNGSSATAPGESQQMVTTVAQLGTGGGVGGVGGEGLGVAVTDPATLTALQTPANNGSTLALAYLYPYDQTVFPRGLLAPLVQWTWNKGNADAIQISLKTTSGSYSYTGTFAPPPILTQTAGTFIRMPIPQDVWTTATNTAGGATPNNVPDQLIMSLVVASGGVGYGPITETWTIAPALLEGTVYYNSYGTALVKNSLDLDKEGNQYGAAVLGIDQGATGPAVVAGTASPVGSGLGCRVCHVVSSDGSTLIVQHGSLVAGDGSYVETSSYDLTNGNAENPLVNYDSIFPWAALSANGTLAFTNAGDLAANDTVSQLYAFPPAVTGATALAVTGIPANLQVGTPAFSPDTEHIAFDFLSGTIGTTAGNGTQLVALDFDATKNAFSNLRPLATMTGGKAAGFPSFFPTDDAVAFNYQILGAPTTSNHLFNTWKGAEAQIWWSDLATGTASNLYALNGLNAGGTSSYLPVAAGNHANDTLYNYEPTVNPVSSGGFIWVIFTSRRLYGNVATTDPWQSDPRNYDATQVANATCKKLWVAALDLNAKAGTDPSHPAFYLPAQELLAGNARGFWALAPCKADGMSCQSGDQCCDGYCEPGEGGLVCSNAPPNATCSAVGDKCTTAANCCDSADQCINGFCAIPNVQ